MASSTTTTRLILHDEPQTRHHLAGSPVGRRLSLTNVQFRIPVSVLIICALVAVIQNQSQQISAADILQGGDKYSSATTFAYPLPEVELKGIAIELESNAEVEWERSAYHFQPDKNFISGINLIFIIRLMTFKNLVNPLFFFFSFFKC